MSEILNSIQHAAELLKTAAEGATSGDRVVNFYPEEGDYTDIWEVTASKKDEFGRVTTTISEFYYGKEDAQLFAALGSPEGAEFIGGILQQIADSVKLIDSFNSRGRDYHTEYSPTILSAFEFSKLVIKRFQVQPIQ